MKLKSRCPQCARSLRVDESWLGKSVQCTACSHAFVLSNILAGSSDSASVATGVLTAIAPVAGKPEQSLGQIGRFELHSVLGQGAFGTVYLSYDPVLDRAVALKIPKFITDQPDKVERFLREAKAAANLRHPNIVTVFESGQAGNDYYISSEYVDGQTLAATIKQSSPPLTQAADWVRDLADAIAHAHDEGIIHRDIKPQNIMVDKRGRPQLMDFGLARRIDDATMTTEGSLLGTPAYMAPEQARGDTRKIGPASDQYSLGVVLYELITGRKPFEGPPHSVLAQIAVEEPPRPRQLRPDISADLEAICQKAMQKEPARRYAGTADLARDLSRWLAGEPTAARPIGLSERTFRWCRRRPAIAALTAALLFVALFGFAGISWQWQVARGEKQRADDRAAAAESATALAEFKTGEVRTALAETERERLRADTKAEEAEANLEEAEAQQYRIGVQLAHREWLANNVSAARRLLAECNSELRDWEWFYCDRLCHLEKLAIRAHPGGILALAVNPKQPCYATGGWDSQAKIWSSTTGQLLRSLPPSPGGVRSLAYNFAGDRLAIGGRDGKIRVFSQNTGDQAIVLRGHSGEVAGLAFSPDGTRLAGAGADATLRVWKVATGKEQLKLSHKHPLTAVVFSPDGKLVATSHLFGATVWDCVSGEKRISLAGFPWTVLALAFSPDGKQIVAGGGDALVRVFESETGRLLHVLKRHTSNITGLAFHPSGKALVSSSMDQTLRVWEGTDEKFVVRGQTGRVTGVAYSPDGNSLVSGCDDGILRVWDANSTQDRTPVSLRGAIRAVNHLAYSPDGKWLALAGADGTVRLCNVKSAAEEFQFKGKGKDMAGLAFSSDSRMLACCHDRVAQIWDIATRNLLRTIEGHAAAVNSVVFDRAGQHIFTASQDRTIKAWTLDGKNVATLSGHPGGVKRVAFHPLKQELASADDKGIVKIWEWPSLRNRLTFEGAFTMAFSPDGNRLVGTAPERAIAVFDSLTGERTLRIRGHAAEATDARFSPDGSRIVSGGWEDGTIRVWDATTGEETISLSTLSGTVSCVEFRPDGQQIASGEWSGRAFFWDAGKAAEKGDMLAQSIEPLKETRRPDGARSKATGNWCLKFSGTTPRQLIPLSLDAAQSYTVEAWVRVDAELPQMFIVGAHANLMLKRYHSRWNVTSATKGKPVSVGVPGKNEIGKLIHVAAVRDADKLTLFVNGTPTKSVALTTPSETKLARVGVGGDWIGLIDEVRISAGARYSGAFKPNARLEPDKTTFALYHCDEGEGTVLHDASSNARHVNLTGTEWAQLP